MADPVIKFKRSSVAGKVPTIAQLPLGELAINTYDGKIFIKQDTGGVGIGTTVIEVGAEKWIKVTTTYTAASNTNIIADTSGGSYTLSLPSSPSTGDVIRFADGNDWSSNNLTIDRNGNTIESTPDNLILDVSTLVTLIYDGSTWKVYSQVGPEGPQGVQGAQGRQGAQGVQGAPSNIPGPQGAQGAQGRQGAQGVQGAQGAQGFQGVQGAQGFQGAQGLQGVQGFQGEQGFQGVQGAQGRQGAQGVQGAQGFQGVQGAQGAQGFQGVQGAQGAQGAQGRQGAQGAQGFQGVQGAQGFQGNDGNFGGATFDYTFSTTITNSDPGTGTLRFNATDISTASSLYIDDTDDNATDIQSFLRTIDDSTSTIKGHFRISNKINANDFAIFTISSITENTGYFTVNCSYVSGSATAFSDTENIIITFARTGDKGDLGPQGNQGVQGAQGRQGSQGVQGATGPTGPQGVQGATGPTGPQGVQGATGPTGPQGVQGATGPTGPQGLQGRQGATGPTGPQGVQGAGGLTTTTADALDSFDTRNSATTPQTYNKQVRFDFKTNTTNGLSDGGTYNGVMYWRKYGSSTDWTGGGAVEIAYSDNANLWLRYGSSTTWGSWNKIWHSGNDGSGSGLDADLLDGLNSSSFVRTNTNSSITGQLHISRDAAGECCSGGNYTLSLAENTAGTGKLARIQFHNSGVSEGYIALSGSGSRRMIFGDNQSVTMGIEATGSITAAGNINSNSDIKLKTNIKTLTNSLNKILQMRGVEYDRIDLEGNPHQIGVIAQEVEEIVPELVSENDGIKNVSYGNITALLIEAIKDQQNIIENQNKRINMIEQSLKNK